MGDLAEQLQTSLVHGWIFAPRSGDDPERTVLVHQRAKARRIDAFRRRTLVYGIAQVLAAGDQHALAVPKDAAEDCALDRDAGSFTKHAATVREVHREHHQVLAIRNRDRRDIAFQSEA